MTAAHLSTCGITPDTLVIDDSGRDWTWAYVLFADIPISGAVGYKIDTLGRVWSSKGRGWRPGYAPSRWKVMHPHANEWGHLRATLRIDGKSRSVLVHRLVLGAFVGPCPPGMEGCHNNGKPADNRLANLRWDTPYNNQMDKHRHGTMPVGEGAPCVVYSEEQIVRVCELLERGLPPWRIASLTGVKSETVGAVRSRRYWTHVSRHYDIVQPKKKNCAQGAMSWRSRYTEQEVREMRRLRALGVSCREIASQFGGAYGNIGKIVRGVSYANV